MSEENLLRVVESDIAWDVHAFLRFCDLSYHSENTKFRVAMGFPTPLLVTEREVLSGQGILNSFREKKGSPYEMSVSVVAELVHATSALMAKSLKPDVTHLAWGTRSLSTLFSHLHNYYCQAEYVLPKQ
jgi:hypothetical protein